MRALVFALAADLTGQQQWRQLARQAALREKGVVVLEPKAYGGQKDGSAASAAGVLVIGAGPAAAGAGLPVPEELHETYAERVAIMVADDHVSHADAQRLAWLGLQAQ